MAEDSGNVADDGNYSVQVIQVALQVWNLSCFPINSPDMKTAKENPLKEEAFVCNLASHWLTIRKIGNEWYNFNSMLDEPQFLSDFYLSAFLDTLMQKGWDIFVVKGELPKYNPLKFSAANPNWRKVRRKRPQGSSSVTSYESDLEAAIAASLGDGDSELAAAIAMSVDNNPPTNPAPPSTTTHNDSMDEELELAIQMSLAGASGNSTTTTTTTSTPMPKEPEEPGSDVDPALITTIVVRLSDGSRLTRKFLRKDSIQAVYDFVAVKTNKVDGFTLSSSFPTKSYEDKSQSLEALGLVPDAALHVVLLN